MQLIGMLDSPHVRRVAVSLRLLAAEAHPALPAHSQAVEFRAAPHE